MIKTPTIKELDESPYYKKVLTLPYDKVASFVVDSLKSKSFIAVIFWIILLALLIINVFLSVRLKNYPGQRSAIMGTFLGYFLIPIALAPLHEGLHWLFLKITGSKDIRIGSDIRQGIIYLTAHRQVIGRKLFTIIAIAPFIIISAGAVLLIFIVLSPWLQWVLSSVLFVHATMCIGDIFLISYMYEIAAEETYTWDDVDAKESYFYICTNQKEAM